jgi:integrase
MTTAAENWKTKNGMQISASPVLPNVWRRRDGGFWVRFKVTLPSGRELERSKVLADLTDPRLAAAYVAEQQEILRRGLPGRAKTIPSFKDFSPLAMEERVNDGTLSTRSTRKKWARVLTNHLLEEEWALVPMNIVTHEDMAIWRADIATRGWERWIEKDGERHLAAKGDRYLPSTLNTMLSIARTIWEMASLRFGFQDPMRGIRDFTKKGHRTHTVENPNQLIEEQSPAFMRLLRMAYPQHYAYCLLMLCLGHRPSMVRPLRRKGPNADIDFKTGRLLVRRSNTEANHVEDRTKTGLDLDPVLPREILDVLAWHIKTQLTTREQLESDLLFPTEEGGYRSRSCLDKPFARICAKLEIPKVTPKGLRRSFKGLARIVEMQAAVSQSISGHQTDAMDLLYAERGVSKREQTTAIAKVFEFTTATVAKAPKRKTERSA